MESKIVELKEGDLVKQGPKARLRRRKKTDLFRDGILGEFVKGSGQYVILPKGTRLLNSVYSLLDDYLRKPLGFEEVVLPKIAPTETFRNADVLRKWDDYLISVKPFSTTKGVKEEYLLDPLQCTVFYEFFRGKRLEGESLPVKWFDRSGPSYRNEDSDKIVPGIKQREFHRAEFIYLGNKRQVVDMREKCLAGLERLCRDLSLKYRIVVGGGCYQLKEDEIGKAESTREIPIKDIEVWCTGHGWVEVAGSSILSETMTSRFRIKGRKGERLWSGCTGIGLDRLVLAIVSAHGADLEKLPEKVKRRLG